MPNPKEMSNPRGQLKDPEHVIEPSVTNASPSSDPFAPPTFEGQVPFPSSQPNEQNSANQKMTNENTEN